ncbi:hypothetical protein GC194_00415 [bacterium]|nr:hypothetical protein [bacterium]
MKLYQIIKLVYRYIIALAVVPVVLAITVFFATKNEQKMYQSGAMIYTGLASGYNIESDGNERFDNYAVNSAFDNFLNIAKSRNTIEQVGLDLLAYHLVMLKEGKTPMNAKDWEEFQTGFPEELRAPFLQLANADSIAKALRDSVQSPTGIFFKKLLHTSESFYSIRTIGKIDVKRKGAGDMVEIAYQTHDPRVCQKTLVIYLKTVLERYRDLKQSETGNAVKYFEQQLKLAFDRLSAAEAELKDFREQNRIINYQEQTRYIAEKQEDAEDEYHKEIMAQRAAESARDELEAKLKISEKISEQNDEILLLKKELSTINTKLTFLSVSEPENPSIPDLEKRADELTKKIKASVFGLYDLSHSIEGVPVSRLLSEWLDYMIEVDKAKARVAQFEVKMEGIERKYDKFAPLGSQLSKLERKVNVAEREYLEILHGLNQAKIKEQSVAMKANLTVVDEPSLPLDPLPSKRKLLVVTAFLAGLMLVLGFAFLTEFLNNGMRSAEGAENITGLQVAGGIPNLNNKTVKKYPEITARAVNFTGVSIESALSGVAKPQVHIISSDQCEGKSHFIQLMQQHWEKTNNNLQADLIESKAHRTGDFSIKDLEKADLVVWVVLANQSWGQGQKRMLKLMQEAGITNIRLVINGMSTFWLDTLIGELPVKRSFIKRFIKRMARLEFSKQNVLA